MKDNFIHVVFVIDSSGSMCGSEADVIGGFKRVVEEQRAVEDGSCAISVVDFNNSPELVCIGKDISDVDSELDYSVGGGTALFDAIMMGINNAHAWNMEKAEVDRPEKTMMVIMTDGGENCSRKYNGNDVRARIKEMETEFGWSFVYLGADLTNVNDAESLGIKMRGVSTKRSMTSNYEMVNSVASSFRSATGSTAMKYATMDSCLSAEIGTLNAEYSAETGININ